MKTLRRIAKWSLIPISASLGGILLFVILLVVPRIKSKTAAFHAAVSLHERRLLDVGPEAQFETHTCGLHALRVIYKAYGLDPDDENLRLRLGVDVPSNPIDPDSTGTLQPDMLRVLVQDGFDYELLSLSDTHDSIDDFMKHLKAGNMAAVLISRRENGNMHWVAVQKVAGENIVILDSLFRNPYQEEPVSFFSDCILSCILVKPSGSEDDDSAAPLRDGIEALKDTVVRYRIVRKMRLEKKGAANTAKPRL